MFGGAAEAAAAPRYGRLLIIGECGAPEVEFPLDKELVLIGRRVERRRSGLAFVR